MKYLYNISLLFLMFTQIISVSYGATNSPNKELLDQYSAEFIDNNDMQLRITHELSNFHRNTLSKVKKVTALTPTDLDYFFSIIRRLIRNDRDRSYLELKLRVLSDLNIRDSFYTDEQRRTFTLLWVATEMIGQDIYNHVFKKIYKSRKLRIMLTNDTNDIGLKKKKVKKYIKKYHNKKRKNRLKNFLKKFMANKNKIKNALSSDFQNELYEIIVNVENSLKIRKESATKTRFAMFKYYLKSFSDIMSIESNDLFSEMSGGFGNVTGGIKWRSGRLKRNKIAIEKVIKNLQPLDILIEKTPFILTDYLIPGHFGHIAIYLGNKKQLEESGIWVHPSIVPYHEEIEKGKVILEATRDGVNLKSIKSFMNVDEVAILRLNKTLSQRLGERTNDIYDRAMSQIGKNYDFNFDVETSDEIVCSELIYQTYYYINWKIEKTMGRWTISPDNIVQELFQDSPKLELILYIKGYMGKRHKSLSIESLRKNIEL